MEQKLQERDIHNILQMYGFEPHFTDLKKYIYYHGENGDGLVKVIVSVLAEDGKRLVIKILHEENDLLEDRAKIENQSEFSEFMRRNGIATAKRYMANGRYCNEYLYHATACNVTVEQWCGQAISELSTEVSYKIGQLMARMHTLSLENNCRIGCGTLFSAAYWNDVDAFPSFCKIAQNENLDKGIVEKIKKLHDEKLEAIRLVWDTLPKAAVQGDISINNLVYGERELTVFDYNNAGDEVLISDLVMEGLLTAYEMEIPEGVDEACREEFFPALLDGYLSIRTLSAEEADAAWNVYTMYHALWFTRVFYREDSLEKLVERGDYSAANRLLAQMLSDMTEVDDGRFRKKIDA